MPGRAPGAIGLPGGSYVFGVGGGGFGVGVWGGVGAGLFGVGVGAGGLGFGSFAMAEDLRLFGSCKQRA